MEKFLFRRVLRSLSPKLLGALAFLSTAVGAELALILWVWLTAEPDPRRIWDPVWFRLELLPLTAGWLAAGWGAGVALGARAGGRLDPRRHAKEAAGSALLVQGILNVTPTGVFRFLPGELGAILGLIGLAFLLSAALGAAAARER